MAHPRRLIVVNSVPVDSIAPEATIVAGEFSAPGKPRVVIDGRFLLRKPIVPPSLVPSSPAREQSINTLRQNATPPFDGILEVMLPGLGELLTNLSEDALGYPDLKAGIDIYQAAQLTSHDVLCLVGHEHLLRTLGKMSAAVAAAALYGAQPNEVYRLTYVGDRKVRQYYLGPVTLVGNQLKF